MIVQAFSHHHDDDDDDLVTSSGGKIVERQLSLIVSGYSFHRHLVSPKPLPTLSL